MTDESAIDLRIEDGRAALIVAPRELGALASLEKMEVALSEPAPSRARAPLRRGRLQAAVITVDERRLAGALAPAALVAAGITDLRLRVAADAVVVRAHATRDGHEADFTARAVVAPASGRRARLEIDDVRVYGFLPAPAPLLGGAILAASGVAGTWAGGERTATPSWSVELDGLDLAVYETFAASGFRLPDISAARLGAVTISPGAISLTWDVDGAPGDVDAAEVTGAGASRPLAEADSALARGQVAEALAGYRAAARGGSAVAARRVLEILVASEDTLAEAAEELGSPRGRPRRRPWAGAAARDRRLARGSGRRERARRRGAGGAHLRRRGERGGGARRNRRCRAGPPRRRREWLRAGRADEARPLLESALAAQPDDARVIELLAACTTAAPAPDVGATQAVTALAVALAEAELADATDRPEAAAAALRRVLDLLDAHDPARADLARRLAALCERLGDDDGALAALRQFLEHTDAGPAVALGWRRVVELHARRGDPQAAARALIASADDSRTGSSDEERAAALTAAAEILRKRLGLTGDAVMLLERALALAPRSVETLDALQTTAVETSDWERLANVLERKIDTVARGPVEQKDLLVQLAEVYDRQLHRAERARDTHERALKLDPAFRPSLTWLARDAWVRGDAAAAVTLYRQLAASEAAAPRAPPEARAETHVRLGALARRAGDDGTAEREAERALAAMPEHPAALDLLIDLLDAQARHGELADVLARRIATDLDRRRAPSWRVGARTLSSARAGSSTRRRCGGRSWGTTRRPCPRCDGSPMTCTPPTTRRRSMPSLRHWARRSSSRATCRGPSRSPPPATNWRPTPSRPAPSPRSARACACICP